MRICILAVTNASYGDYCIAGMTENGEWIRPVPNSEATRFWSREQLTKLNGEFLKTGDVIEFTGRRPDTFRFQNHTEDRLVIGNFKLVETLENEQLIRFLDRVAVGENEFLDTIHANRRSLCLIRIRDFRHHITQFENQPRKAKMNLANEYFDVNNPFTKRADYIVKDCKWSSLILNDNLPNLNYEDIFICIGLATPFNNIEYPQIIGVHTNPEVPILVPYPG